MAEMLARYFTNAALHVNNGGDHVSSLTGEDDRFRSIREVYKENNFGLRWL